jgi:trimeric autotransporter adhesin
MFRRNTSKYVRRQYALVLAIFCVLNLLTLPLTNKQNVQAQNLNTCTTDQSFEGTAFALTSNNTLVNFDPGTPGAINSARFITGLSAGETIVAIDFRPATGQLFGVSDGSRLYIINPATGTATQVGTTPFTPALSGTVVGFDFNPTVDRIRVVTSTGQNLRLNPLTGAVAGTDTSLAFVTGDPNASATPNITSVAYTNNSVGTTSTTLFGIDPNLDALVRIGSVGGTPTSPNTGQLTTIGPLGVNATNLVGFDILPGTNAGFVALTLQDGTTSQLFTVNLTTGAVTPVGAIGGGQLIRDLAFASRTENIYALVCDSNTLLRFNAGAPGIILNTIQITGLSSATEKIIGIDFRPASGQLFGVSNASRIYSINTTTGGATPVGTAAFTPALSGATFGIDFNPAVDRLRVVSNTGQNLRLNPATGAVAGTDTNLAFVTGDVNAGATPNLTSVAYTNNFAGTTSTTLFGIDTTLNALVTLGSANGTTSPNTGQLFTVGALGVDPNDTAGFDISPVSGAAFAAFSVGTGAPQLYSINTTTGTATAIGPIGTGQAICDIAVEVNPSTIFGVTAGNTLVSFNAGAPGVINNSLSITGLIPGETIVGLDFRPATGELFALSGGGRIYIINTTSAQATLVSDVPLNPALNGTVFGFNFNPTVDRIRLVSNTGQNLRINPLTGAVVGTDTNLVFATGDPNAGVTPNLLGVAYINGFLGATGTTLFGVDASGALVTIGSPNGTPTSPNAGQLFTVGSLGITVTGQVGFDIAPGSNAAFITVTPATGGPSQLYAVNLTTGAATLVGLVGLNDPLRVLAVGNLNSITQVSNFQICLQDDATGDNLQINICTGDYQFTRCGVGGFTLTGRGSLGRGIGTITLRDARVTAFVSVGAIGPRNTGRAVIKLTIFGPTFIVEDRSSGNSDCNCR